MALRKFLILDYPLLYVNSRCLMSKSTTPAAKHACQFDSKQHWIRNQIESKLLVRSAQCEPI